MKIILETERLLLREYTADDFDALHKILSDPETMQHYPAPYDEAGTRHWIDWSLENYAKYGFGLWAVVLKETGEFIGDCGLTIQNIDGEQLPEIGYHINKRYWRRGYAKEAARAVRDWAFRNTSNDALYSYMKYTNTASYATALANGMKKVKEYPDPKNTISYACAITREKWEALAQASAKEARPERPMNLKLIRLTKEYEEQLGEMIREWKADQERNHTDCSPWVIFKNDYHDFDFYLEHLETKEAAGGLVPDSVFFLLDEDRNLLLGAVNIRHYLNETLLKDGGHIGDGIRPGERRKGYATEMIRLALIECKKLGIDRVLMICDKENIGSAKSIQRNGGVLESESADADGVILQRYWIAL